MALHPKRPRDPNQFGKNDRGHCHGARGGQDAWTWTAICADTKLLISTLIGGRGMEYALHFVDDLRWRLDSQVRVQMTSDDWRPYLEAVDTVFGEDADYAMLQKLYGADPQADKRYSPVICTGALKRIVTGCTCASSPPHQRILKEARKSRLRGRAASDVL